ncbi:MAG TPA: hypothetical protein VF677_10500 [Flavobacterium sp.]|jgi:hypothetical protein
MPFSWLHCGRVTIAEGCFCNRGFTEKEFKNIVIELRKQEKTGVKQTLVDKNNTNRYAMGEPIRDKDGNKIKIELTQYDELGENLFNLNLPEKINSSEANFESFSLSINKALGGCEIIPVSEKSISWHKLIMSPNIEQDDADSLMSIIDIRHCQRKPLNLIKDCYI